MRLCASKNLEKTAILRDGWEDGWMDGRMDGWMDGRMGDRRKDGWGGDSKAAGAELRVGRWAVESGQAHR